VLGGERGLDSARRASGVAEVTVEWRTLLGVACPLDVRVAAPAGGGVPGAAAALLSAAHAHRRALEAAARVAVLEGALRRIDAALRATSLRRNAVQHRWIPAHEEALAALELALEEVEREDAVRVRWAVRASAS
jgi:V/A-type H+-transporting ATPase subunit D